MPDSTPRKRGFLRGWRMLILAVVAIAAFVWIDGRTKGRAEGVGFCPEGATWIVVANDFGAFWESTAQTQAIERLREEWPRPLAGWELAIRQATGIRPTPARWRLWMGRRFLAASAPEGRGLCVYPGLLMRGVLAVHRLFSDAEFKDEVQPFGDLFYGWRDGFLIVSESESYVAAALAAAEPDIEPSHGSGELRFHWRSRPEGFIRIRAEEGLPVEGRIHFAVAPRNGPLTLTDAWPEPPMLAVTAAGCEDVRALLQLLTDPLRDVPGWTYVDRSARMIWQQWGFDTLPEGWNRPVDHCALAVLDAEIFSALPMPRVALALRCTRPLRGTPHPLAGMVQDVMTVPYEWQEHEGLLAPLAGEHVTLCLARDGLDWLATSEEPLMNELLGSMGQGAAPECDIALRVDWRKAASTAERLLMKWGELDLIPRMGSDDVRYQLAPMARGFANQGTLEIDGRAEGEWLVFEGSLAHSGAEAAP